MNKEELQYLSLLDKILNEGYETDDRTGVGTYKLFGNQIRFDLSKGFPLLTTKKINFNHIVVETLWYLSGNTNVGYLNSNGVKIWNKWANESGDLGKVYGFQWKKWFKYDHLGGLFASKSINQIDKVIKQIKNEPGSRRMIVSSWNVSDLDDMALPPCHCLFQFNVGNGKLSCQLYQRSSDVPIGLPYNIASYALLTHIIASHCNLEVGELIVSLGDYHIYKDQLTAVKEQLTRIPKEFPKLVLKTPITDVDSIDISNFELVGYDPHPAIRMPVAV